MIVRFNRRVFYVNAYPNDWDGLNLPNGDRTIEVGDLFEELPTFGRFVFSDDVEELTDPRDRPDPTTPAELLAEIDFVDEWRQTITREADGNPQPIQFLEHIDNELQERLIDSALNLGMDDDPTGWSDNRQVRMNKLRKFAKSELPAPPSTPPSPPAPPPPFTPVWLGGGKLQLSDTKVAEIEMPLANVLEALINMKGAAGGNLATKSGYADPGSELRKAVKRYPELAPHIRLPGRKGRGGYSTTIIDGTKPKQ